MENKFYNIEEQKNWNNLSMWSESGHEWSKSFGTTENLWNTHIFDSLKKFRNKRIVEIAPGHGRITQFLSILASQLIVVDLNENCIEETRKKLGHHVLAYFVNDGKSLTGIKDESQDLVFSFDSFVHMHKNVIEEYLKEIKRVLVKDGYGWIHHSWFEGGEDLSFSNLAGRSNMSPEIFHKMLDENGFEVISQVPISFDPLELWNGTDCISIFKKI